MTDQQINEAANKAFSPILRDMISRGRARDIAVQLIKDLHQPEVIRMESSFTLPIPPQETFRKADLWDKLIEIIKHHSEELVAIGIYDAEHVIFAGMNTTIREIELGDAIEKAYKTIK